MGGGRLGCDPGGRRTAAAALIASEAGATVTDALGRTLRFNSTKGEMFGVLASAPGIHQAAVERLSSRAATAVAR